MSDLVGNPKDRFSRVAAQFIPVCLGGFKHQTDRITGDVYDELPNNIDNSLTKTSYFSMKNKTVVIHQSTSLRKNILVSC